MRISDWSSDVCSSDLAEFVDADVPFFDDLVGGAAARGEEIDRRIADKLARGWTLDRLDKSMKAILRAGAYELIARPDVPAKTVISEYLDVADAFYDKPEKGFVHGLLDTLAQDVRACSVGERSEARRVGEEGDSQCIY